MASVLLTTAGSAAAKGLGGGLIAQTVAGRLGGFLGGSIDDLIFGPRRLQDREGARLEELAVQTSTYGKTIPIVFGSVRIGGNIIWSRPIEETANVRTNTQSGGKGGGGGKVTQKSTTYTYSVSLAIAICEGEIDDVIRVWADSKIIDASFGTYRLYKGSETQQTDPFIESFEGVGKTPAYRGMAYVVIEDFPLGDFGNRIPNFTFEVKRKVRDQAADDEVENRVKSIKMIPGSGEWVYDTQLQKKVPGYEIGSTFVQNGSTEDINLNNNSGKADALLALDQLDEELPNNEYISVVVGWFGTSIDAGLCEIIPGVEYQGSAQTSPEVWTVANYSRATAHPISQVDGSPVYGGTPDDESLVRYVDEIKSRDKKVLFYPFVFMDVVGKPWRGRITGSETDVANIFTRTKGYADFINHYATLLAGKVDAFCIGSEMIGLTSVQATDDSFPAVDQFVSLAATVKSTLGASTQVSYAADWTEYHSANGWYNLDPLWASPNIDVIGIDAYFPLTDELQTGYDKQKIIDGWTSGEGYDWFYSDAARTVKTNLQQEYAWKNIEWWWKNTHTNPDSNNTSWVPESKKIWFTEFGFPSIDGATNQPNVFYDPDSSESSFPRHSRGRVDYRIQRLAIEATYDAWEGSDMVEELFLWTWDARPFPYFPDLRNVWSDGGLWLFGHWVNGKLGLSQLSEIIKEIAQRVGLSESDVNVDKIYDFCDGFVLNKISSARQALEQLQNGFFYDAFESDNVLEFLSRGQEKIEDIAESEIVPQSSSNKRKLIETKVQQEVELPQKVDVSYIDRILSYQQGNQHAQREATSSKEKLGVSLPIVMNEWQARRVAEVSLYNAWLSRQTYSFALPIKYADLEPTDVININGNQVRITESLLGANGEVRVKAVAEDAQIYDFYSEPVNEGTSEVIEDISQTRSEILDLPAFPSDDVDKAYIRIAATGLGDNWNGAVTFRSDDGGDNFESLLEMQNSAIMGEMLDELPEAIPNIFDEKSKVRVAIVNGELESRNKLAILNGANIALIGNELIQFKNASLIAENTYEISCLLRGRLGTENEILNHAIGDRFVLIDGALEKDVVSQSIFGLERKYKTISVGKNIADVAAIDFSFNANGLKPYSPVHINGERDANGDLNITWIRRTRIGGDLRDSVETSLSEAEEKYEIDILDGLETVRTITSSSSEVTYTEQEQIDDFGSAQASVSMKIYQISALIGRGAAGSAII